MQAAREDIPDIVAWAAAGMLLAQREVAVAVAQAQTCLRLLSFFGVYSGQRCCSEQAPEKGHMLIADLSVTLCEHGRGGLSQTPGLWCQ